MFGISGYKLFVSLAVALAVIGPKDLMALLRTLGRYIGQAQRMASEFKRQVTEAIAEHDIADVRAPPNPTQTDTKKSET